MSYPNEIGPVVPYTRRAAASQPAIGFDPEGPEISPSGRMNSTNTASLRRQLRDAARQAAYAPAQPWLPGEVLVVQDVRVFPNGELAVVTTAGTTGTTAPSYTPGATPGEITDNTVRWWLLGQRSSLVGRAWAASTVVRAGQIMYLTATQRLRASVGGTTGATAPTYATSGTISDGTVTWVAEDLPTPLVSIVESSGATSLGNVVNFLGSADSFDQYSAPNLVTVAGSGTTLRNSAWSHLDGSTNDSGFGANGQVGKFRAIEFMTEADVIDVGIFSITAGSPNLRLQVRVDGVLAGEAPIVPGATGSSRKFTITIGGARRRRRIRVSTSGNMNLQYAAVASNATISRPTQRAPMVAMFMDSFFDTEQPAYNLALHEAGVQAAELLGFSHLFPCGVGGTSYTANAGGRRNLVDVLNLNTATLMASPIDAVVVGHGYNAPTAGTAPAVEAAAAVVAWTKLREITSSPLVIIGPWYVTVTYAAQMPLIRDALKRAFLEFADANSVFIDPLDGSVTAGNGTVIRPAGVAWINSSNAAWALPPAGGGFDGAHVSVAGRALLIDCIVQTTETALSYLQA